MSAQALNSAGLLVKYAPEVTAGTRPVTGYVELKGVKAIPAFGDEVPTLQSTPLSATTNHTYEPALRDSGGSIQLTVNDASEFRTSYDAMLTAYTTAVGNNLGMWIEYAYPTGSGLESFYFPAEPIDIGFGGAEVDSILENMANLLPKGDYVFAAASS